MKKLSVVTIVYVMVVQVWSVMFVGAALAHDLWLNVDTYSLQKSAETDAKVVFGHNYPYYGILVKQEQLSAFFYLAPDGHKTVIDETREELHGESYGKPAGARVGAVHCSQEGTYIVAAAKKRKGDALNVPSEKYAKAIIVVGEGSSSVSQPVGQRIEIVPLKNPSEVKAGEFFPVQVLYEGKPLSTFVYGTYAGYSSSDEPFPVLARSNASGIAQVKIEQAGTWMIVCNHKIDFSASLTFVVQ